MRALALLLTCILLAYALQSTRAIAFEAAKTTRAGWHDASVDFDYVSSVELGISAGIATELKPQVGDLEFVKQATKVENPDLTQVQKWFATFLPGIEKRFAKAANADLSSWTKNSLPKLEKENPEWINHAREFYRAYFFEQMRLAALFSKTSSEVMAISPDEILGTHFSDKEFLLSFDDGPTPKDDSTDGVVKVLKGTHKNAFFFVLGENLEKRVKAQGPSELRSLFEGTACLGSHGYSHKPHTKWSGWQSSIDKTNALLSRFDSLPKSETKKLFFRPSYGQRNEQMLTYLKKLNATVVLWNIDSQDWQHKLTDDEVLGRTISLMLFWRGGIILFHDVKKRTPGVLASLLQAMSQPRLAWMDCRQLEK